MPNIEHILQELRPEFNKNGADLIVEEMTEYEVTLRLTFSDEACMDCILPGPLLEQGIARYLRQQAIDLAISVIDPREPG